MDKTEKLFNELQKLSDNSKDEIQAMDLLNILKNESKEFSIESAKEISFFMQEELKYIPSQYKDEYSPSLSSQTLKIIEIKNDKTKYTHTINKNTFKKAILTIEKFLNFDNMFKGRKDLEVNSVLVSIYLLFIVFKPIHPVGMVFPGGNLKIEEINGIYYCPAKTKQLNNPNAICPYCICKPS